jgi:hypothetical protein
MRSSFAVWIARIVGSFGASFESALIGAVTYAESDAGETIWWCYGTYPDGRPAWAHATVDSIRFRRIWTQLNFLCCDGTGTPVECWVPTFSSPPADVHEDFWMEAMGWWSEQYNEAWRMFGQELMSVREGYEVSDSAWERYKALLAAPLTEEVQAALIFGNVLKEV